MWSRRAVLGSGLALGAGLLLPGQSRAATDQLTIALAAEPPQLDPTAGDAPATEAVAFQNLFEGLTRIDRDGRLQPCLARSWIAGADGRSYRFTLEPSVRYHDGTSFDAGHVVFSLERLIAPESRNPHRGIYAAITGATALDDTTVEVTLAGPDADLLRKLALGPASIVAPESADNNGLEPIGTGPFAYQQWDRGADIVLVRNEDYWGTHPRLSQVDFVFYPDPAAAVAALLGGTLDAYPDFPEPALLAPLQGNPALQLVTGKAPDGSPRVGVWSSKLSGMWPDAPVASCVLADLRWADDHGAPLTPMPDPTTDD